jgi:hypothetical protein
MNHYQFRINTLKTILFIALIILYSFQAYSEEARPEQIHNGYIYQKPTWLQPFTSMPRDFGTFFSDSFSKDKIGAWSAIAASTTLLVIYDRQVTNQTQRFGRHLGIGNDDHTKDMVKVGTMSIFRGPTDIGSAFYFIGDGWTTLALTASFLGVGAYTQDFRALQTGAQLFQGLLMTGIVTQTIKRTTGRESPIKATDTETGRWRPFPSFSTYNAHISSYDAFPSGHLATTIMGITIIAENYEEYTWIRPVGYTCASLLAFQMVNNSVHWASDYPLAIGIGYMMGRSISKNGRKKVQGTTSNEKVTYDWGPKLTAEGNVAMGLDISY